MLDTHVHTCLSPCGDLDMHPAALVAAAHQAGLDAIAVCDHNTARNVAATVRAGLRTGVAVLPGMEITTEEEVHVVALLPDVDSAERLQDRVYRDLPGRNDPSVFGEQVVVDEDGTVLGFEEHLLIGATRWRIERVVEAIHDAGGLAVAAHVDRERFGIIGQLGLVPAGLPLDGIEVSRQTPLAQARARFDALAVPVVTASDAHHPKDVGTGVSLMLLERPVFAEVRHAFRGLHGRAVLGGGNRMEDLALHVLDIAHNALEAGATRIEIALVEDLARDLLTIEIADNGRGMPAELVAQARDPFCTTRTTRRVGLGLPLLAEAARASGGDLTIESQPGEGTRVHVRFQHSHADRAPLGDLEGTLMALIAGHPEVDVRFRHALGGRDCAIGSREVADALGGRPVQSPEGLACLRRMIRDGEAGLKDATAAKE